MDYLEDVKSRFAEYYKMSRKKETDSRQNKIEQFAVSRRETRTKFLSERRKMSLLLAQSPLPPEEVVNPKQVLKTEKNDRLLKLQQWKQEREKKKLQQEKTAKKKPVFKLGAPTNIGFPTNSFAPKHHQFKAPKNIKPIKLKNIDNNADIKNPILRVTRSTKPVASPPLELPTKRKKNTPVKMSKILKKTTELPKKLPLRENNKKLQESNKKVQEHNKKVQKNKLKRQNAITDDERIVPKNIDEKSENNSITKMKLADEPINEEKLTKKSIDGKKTEKSSKKLRRSSRKSLGKRKTNDENIENLVPRIEIETPVTDKNKRSTRRLSKKNKTPIKPSSENEIKTPRRQSLRLKSKTESTQNFNTFSSSSSTEYSMDINNSTIKDEVFLSDEKKTPENNNKAPVYVSPYVTTSRGKGSMKKENKERSFRGLPSFSEFSTPDKLINTSFQQKGAEYFHIILDNEISRLEAMCKTWNDYKESADISEDAKDMIDVAVGQANLLINKKFQQFRGLIVSCESGFGQEKPVTCADLQGFWDMVYMQVQNLNIRFDRLTELKNNNWEEIAPVVEKKVVKKRITKKKNAAVSSSGIRAAIQAARKNKQSKSVGDIGDNQTVFNGGFFVVKSPRKSTPVKKVISTPAKSRRSLLVSVLSAETKKQTQNMISPGVTMMKATQIAKSIENLVDNGYYTVPTPGKSILKKTPNKSFCTKMVLFKDDDDNY